MTTTTIRHYSVTSHHITFEGDHDFEVEFEPSVMIDPALEIDMDGRATVTYATHDPDCQSPREDYEHFATLVQQSRSYADVDRPDLDIAEAVEHFNSVDKLQRYLSMFRQDILHFEDYVTIGSGYGYAYVTRDQWESAMGMGYVGDRTPADLLRDELDEYSAWAAGETYGIVREIFLQDEDGGWVASDDDPLDRVWGVIGMEYAQQSVSEGNL